MAIVGEPARVEMEDVRARRAVIHLRRRWSRSGRSDRFAGLKNDSPASDGRRFAAAPTRDVLRALPLKALMPPKSLILVVGAQGLEPWTR